MTIGVTSLTEHRIDIKFADYIVTALEQLYDVVRIEDASILENTIDLIIVTNGVLSDEVSVHTKNVLLYMKNIPSIYLIDDHTCWVPEDYYSCTIISQFTKHPISDTKMEYFQVSELALFDSSFDDLWELTIPDKAGSVYWGQYKPERHEQYKKFLQPGTTVIGRRYPAELSKNWIMGPFTKDLDHLKSMLIGHYSTPVFGDKFHDGTNFPYRIYEAFMCGIKPIISTELIGNRTSLFNEKLGWLYDCIACKLEKEDYAWLLNEARTNVTNMLSSFIESTDVYRTYAAKAVQDNIESSIDDVLSQRATVYGTYISGVECRSSIMNALNEKHIATRNKDLPESVRVVFSDLILKLMRAASDPSHADSWLDLAGYSKLIHEMFEENPDVFES
jgi:hypothetical protein